MKMGQSLFTNKNIQTLVKISEIEIITILRNKMTFFYLLYKLYIMVMKAYFT